MGVISLGRIVFSKIHIRKKLIMQRTHRSAFTKFRMGVAPLRIETGRYERLEENKKVCFNWDDAAEYEEHALLDCPLYQELRKIWITKLTHYRPDFCLKMNQEKLVYIFSCDVIPVIRISAKICNDILMERRKLLYR